ncbi:MAG TPA: hypothetical protein VKM54_16420 [Myxococcota bacterium]|nr:hypothetical protein [Myxococcota bacterium]
MHGMEFFWTTGSWRLLALTVTFCSLGLVLIRIGYALTKSSNLAAGSAGLVTFAIMHWSPLADFTIHHAQDPWYWVVMIPVFFAAGVEVRRYERHRLRAVKASV